MGRLSLRLALATTLASVTLIAVSVPAAFSDGDPSGGSSTGMFVVGDGSAVPGASVEFWGAQWADDNAVSGGAPDAFKGFADVVVNNGCSGTFTASPGNSSQPPDSIDGTVYVLVTTGVTKSGDVISGTFNDIVQVTADPGYAPDPGHPGTGVVVGSVCGTTG